MVTSIPIGAGPRETIPEPAFLDREAIDTATLRFLRPRRRNRPDLRLLHWQGEHVVAKDWRNAPWYLRFHARRCIDREWRALEALAGLPDVPRLIARLPEAIVVSHLDGEPIAHLLLRRVGREGFFVALCACVERIHARGVVHFDLRQRRNILCNDEGQPSVIDFEAALVLDPTGPFGKTILFWLRKIDRLAILKHKVRYAPHLLAMRERRLARMVRLSRWVWPATVLHRVQVAWRRLRQDADS